MNTMKLITIICILSAFILLGLSDETEKAKGAELILEKNLVLQDSMASSQETLYGLNLYGEKFPLHIKELIQDLCIELYLDYTIYENDLEGLIKVLGEQIKLKKNTDFYKSKFLNLIALIGEAANKKMGSSWIMELSGYDNVTWNTFLLMQNEKVVFHTYLYEDIFLADAENEYLVEDVYQTVLDIINIDIAKK